MDIFKIIGVGLITLVASLIVKQHKPEFAVLICVVGSCIIFLMIVGLISNIFSSLNSVIARAGLSGELFGLLVKIVGIGYITEFACSTCIDSNNSNLASKIELAGKLIILTISLPIFSSIFEIIVSILP